VVIIANVKVDETLNPPIYRCKYDDKKVEIDG
jgi:hypothetical protein